MVYLLFSIIILSPLLFIITNLRRRIKKKENLRALLMKSRIYIFILVCAIVGLALARIKFYIEYGI